MNKEMKKRINMILLYMPKGRDNAVSMRYIAQMTGSSERDVRAIVNFARLSGHMIVGDDHGYYLADTDEELVGYCYRLRSRVKTTQSILDKVMRVMNNEGIDPDDTRGIFDEE